MLLIDRCEMQRMKDVLKMFFHEIVAQLRSDDRLHKSL